MGYSISVRFSSSDEADKMSKFLMSNQDLLLEMQKLESPALVSYFNNIPSREDNLPYAPEKNNLLGFHGTGIPRYIWNLCAWMTVKSSFRDKNNKLYFYYDEEKMIVSFDEKNTQDTIVNQEGIRIEVVNKNISAFMYKFLVGDYKDEQRKILEELNTRWITYSLEKKPKNKV